VFSKGIKIFSTLLLFHLVSCKNVESTNTETNAVQQVLNFYGGECLKSEGVNSENGNNKTFFELEMRKSVLLDSEQTNKKLHSGNIAYLFYSNLEKEKSNYDEIKVKIVLDGGHIEEYSYQSKELDEIEKHKVTIDQVNTAISEKKYDELISFFDKTITINASDIRKLFENLEQQSGKMARIQFQGFEFKQTNNFGDVILMNEAVVFGETALSMNVILKRDNNKLIAIEFN